MKNYLSILLVAFFPSLLLSQNLSIGKWKISKFGVSFGVEQDMIQGMDGNYLIATAKDVEVDIPEGMTFTTASYAMVCENPILQLYAVLDVPKLKNTELQFGLNIIIGRLDEAYYSNDGSYFDEDGRPPAEYLSVSSFSNEVGLELGLTRYFALRPNLNFHLGAGANLGLSYDGDIEINASDLSIIENNKERSFFNVWTGEYESDHNYYSFDFKNAFHQRLTLQTGLSFVMLRRLELGFHIRGGIGYKSHINGPRKATHLMGGGFSAKWLLKKS